MSHELFMRRCIELAKIAKNNHNTPVGSIVVLNKVIIAEGYEELPKGNNITAHAEIVACQNAVEKLGVMNLNGATLYSTAEPCFMCSFIIRQLEISKVVYGADTVNIGGVTSSHRILTDENISNWNPAPAVIGGVSKLECLELRKPAFEKR